MSSQFDFESEKAAVAEILKAQGQEPLDILTTLICMYRHLHLAHWRQKHAKLNAGETIPLSQMDNMICNTLAASRILSDPTRRRMNTPAGFAVNPAWLGQSSLQGLSMARKLWMVSNLLNRRLPQSNEELELLREIHWRSQQRQCAEQQQEPPAFQ